MLRSKRVKISKSGMAEAQLLEYYCATHIRHAGNKPEWYGRPFYLEEWQKRNIWYPVFGTGRTVRAGGRSYFKRRYRTALIGMPRDFGKTELICSMMLSEANMHVVHEGQYGIVAYDEDQARKILKTLGAMIRQDHDLKALWEVGKTEIENRDTGAVIKVFPYSEGAVQSWHYNVLIADELHVWSGTSVWDAIVSGMGQVENSLLLAITTAGEDRRGLLWELLNGSEDVTCIFDDPHAYCWWWGADEDADIDDERVWERLALPSWISVDNIRALRRKLTRRNFERYVLNRFPTIKRAERAMRPADIRACALRAGGVDFSRRFVLAVDGAVRGDSFAVVAHQKGEDGADNFHEWVFDTPPEDTGVYNVAAIGQLVAGLHQKYGCPVGIDPARLMLWATTLQDDYGVEIYEISQNNRTMCAATQLLVHSVSTRHASFEGCPKLAEHCENAVAVSKEPWGERLGSERHGQGSPRIDAAVAGAMAMWMTSVMPEELTFEETGGVWSVDVQL